MALQDIVTKGSTDRSVPIYAFDNTTGLAKTDLVFNSSGLALWYRREGAAQTAITEVTLAALTTAHTDGGFLAVGDGEYRLDLPDAAFATGANYVDYGGTATGYTLVGGRVKLINANLEDSVRAGLTALPNAAADAAGGLPISDAGGLDMDALLADTNDIQSRLPAALVSGRMDASVGAMAANVMTAAAAASDLTTELQSGLATAAALSAVAADVDNLVSGIIFGAAATGTLSTTVATSNLTGYSNDQLIGRTLIWLTGDCEGEATRISDYASASGTLTFTALTTAPGNGDTFKIV